MEHMSENIKSKRFVKWFVLVNIEIPLQLTNMWNWTLCLLFQYICGQFKLKPVQIEVFLRIQKYAGCAVNSKYISSHQFGSHSLKTRNRYNSIYTLRGYKP